MRKRIFGALQILAFVGFASGAWATDAEMLEDGEMAYETNCAPCHGIGLKNNGLTYDLRRLKSEERPRFVNSVLNGKNKKMPPWKGVLEPQEIDAIWAFIRAKVDK